ncbi:response regulator [Roseobacter sp. N2S]|uniref:response regulator n=1 Tax=Roseobacter sp. N2S TaxID=2663844 RepID=UPI002854423A|nr:response regulator [Roseobacter sp. N2S]MDR6263703.1 CheY-like chemotaxis protein [Roseobacter sp. N2S]
MTFEVHKFIPEGETPAITNLMVVDDNKVDQMIYRRIIKRSGLVGTVYQFLSAEEALKHLRRKDRSSVDAILLDINMPRMDGFEFLSAATDEMGDSFTAMVVIMLTTSLDPSDEHRASQYSVVKEYLNKPLVVQHLYEISEYLARKAQSTAEQG